MSKRSEDWGGVQGDTAGIGEPASGRETPDGPQEGVSKLSRGDMVSKPPEEPKEVSKPVNKTLARNISMLQSKSGRELVRWGCM